MERPDYGRGLRSLHELAPTAVADSLAGLAHAAGAVDVVLYLVDFESVVLTPVPARGAHVDLPVGEPVEGSAAGQAFRELRLVSERRAEGFRVWVPVLEGPDCTGVLALTVAAGREGSPSGPGDTLAPEVASRCEELGMLAGCAVAMATRSTDLYNLVRRRKAMSLPASMQWDLLPPLRLEVPEATSVGVLEPAYDVGGDCFDHAVNGFDLDVVIMDAMGHGLASSLTSSLAMGAYRHDRREGQSVATIHQRLDRVIGRQWGGDTFVTGQIARLALRTGRLTWVNAGHPAPLLVRAGRVVANLACAPSLPWGLGGGLVEQATEWLQPGDAVLFHTDGVTEGRSIEGEALGLERFVAIVEAAARSAEPSASVLRRLAHDVLAYQGHRLRDDATMVWVAWRGEGSGAPSA